MRISGTRAWRNPSIASESVADVKPTGPDKVKAEARDSFQSRGSSSKLPGVLRQMTGVGSSTGGKALLYGAAAAVAAGAFLSGQSGTLLGALGGAAAGLSGGAMTGTLVSIGAGDQGMVPVQLFPLVTAGSALLAGAGGAVLGATLAGAVGGPLAGAAVAALSLPGALAVGKILERNLA